jgi:tetratricopeptide (TPR) repeat protein
VNSILGDDAAEATITAAIDFDDVTPALRGGNPDWSAIRQKVSKYGELGEELVQQTQVLYSVNNKDYDLFAKVAGDWFKNYGSKRKWIADEMLNNVAWAVFENTTDKNALQAALEMSKQSISIDTAAHRVDTYANLLYKLGNKEEGIKWEIKALEISPNETAYKEALEKMKKGEKTWP